MLTRTTVVLVVCILNLLDIVLGICEDKDECSKLIVVTYPCGYFGQTCTKYYLVLYDCPECVDGNWGTWGEWSEPTPCSRTCCEGTRTQMRTRLCDNPSPIGKGALCEGAGNETRTETCGSNTDQCPRACTGDENETFSDTCRRCVPNFYTCRGAAAGSAPSLVTGVCNGGLVWTNAIQACARPIICDALEPPLA